MNLHDAGVPYTSLPDCVLKLHTKTELLHTIEMYHRRSTEAAGAMSRWQHRQRRESIASLLLCDVLRKSEEHPEKFDLLPVDNTAKDRITIPAEYDYSRLPMVAIKTLLACHATARYSRTPFRFTARLKDLAEVAGIAERRLRDGLHELEQHHFLSTKKEWRPGTRITLHEPNSDTPLYWLAEYHRGKRNAVPVCERYRYLLTNYDPKDKLRETTGPVTGYRVFCPFCRCRSDGPTFAFTSTDEDDQWHCYNCRLHGKSDFLWAKLSNWSHKTDWRTIMADTRDNTPEFQLPEVPNGDQTNQ